MKSEMPEILVVGAGAVGTFYGAKLASAGAKVTLLCRSDYDVVKENGIEVKSIDGDLHFKPSRVIRKASECGAPPDFVLVALKYLPQLIDTAEIIRAAIGPDTSIFHIQNGIEIEKETALAFPNNEILSAVAFICVTRTAPGFLHHSDYGRLVVGRYPGGSSEKVELLKNLFNKSGVECAITDDIMKTRFLKLVWNVPFNAISVLGNHADTRSMLENKLSCELSAQLMEEVCGISEAYGRKFPDDTIENYMVYTRKMKPYKTSMLVDFEAGRPMEVEAILGNLVRMADEKKLDIPRIRTLYGLLSLADRKADK